MLLRGRDPEVDFLTEVLLEELEEEIIEASRDRRPIYVTQGSLRLRLKLNEMNSRTHQWKTERESRQYKINFCLRCQAQRRLVNRIDLDQSSYWRDQRYNALRFRIMQRCTSNRTILMENDRR